MLNIHIGMPKTGTTTFQKILSENSDLLAEQGTLYPSSFRNKGGIAHHAIPLAIQESTPQESSLSEIYIYLKEHFDKNIILSSEGLTNLVSGDHIVNLLFFLKKCREHHEVRVIICLREMDDFFESMYLQETKSGKTTVCIEDYLAERRFWPRQLFNGISMIKGARVCSVESVVYSQDETFLSNLFRTFGLQSESFGNHPKHLNRRLGLKAQTALLHLPIIEKRLGRKIDRANLIHQYETGELIHDDDVYDYSIFTEYQSAYLKEIALRAAIEFNIYEYERPFMRYDWPVRRNMRLDLSRFNETDYDQFGNLG